MIPLQAVPAQTAHYRAGIECSDNMRAAMGGSSGSRATKDTTMKKPAVVKPVVRAHGSNIAPRRLLSHSRFDAMKKTDPFDADCKFSKDLPCHVNHGSCRNEIQWDISTEELQGRAWTLLVTAAAGLRVRTHPHAVKCRKGFTDLCNIVSNSNPEQLKTVTQHIRSAMIEGLQNDPDKTQDVFFAALDALGHLSDKFGEQLNPILGPLLVPLSKALKNKNCAERVDSLLHTLCRNGGDDTAKAVKSRIPCFTYT